MAKKIQKVYVITGLKISGLKYVPFYLLVYNMSGLLNGLKDVSLNDVVVPFS